MKHLILAAGLALGALSPAWSNESDIQDTIRNQIDAFLKDDFATAFTFASPMIQGIFGSSDRFGSMVKNGYPMVHRPSDVQFAELLDMDGSPVQRVVIRDGNGVFHTLDYEMVELDGIWKINGVQFARAPEVGA